jgi:hypothetical protein
MPDHAHDRVRETGDYIEGQVSQRVSAGRPDDEQSAAGR